METSFPPFRTVGSKPGDQYQDQNCLFPLKGSLEIRADGTIHEWTLENQSPGGSAKLGPGALDLATFGVRVSSSLGRKAALLRTHPPSGYPGVHALSYSGSFPISRLSVRDEGFFGVQMDLFAYGTMRPRQSDASFVPAIAFTLNVKNPTQKSANVSFLLNLPLGMQTGMTLNLFNGDNLYASFPGFPADL